MEIPVTITAAGDIIDEMAIASSPLEKASLGMISQERLRQTVCLALLSVVCSAALTGCQTQMGGQTLPSAFYLRDDIQYFPAGPEELLPNQERALSEYRAEQQAIRDGMNAP